MSFRLKKNIENRRRRKRMQMDENITSRDKSITISGNVIYMRLMDSESVDFEGIYEEGDKIFMKKNK